jgi:hypothetical protein
MVDKIYFNTLRSSLKSMEAVKSDERYFEGLLTVEMKDKQGEITIVDELYKVLPVWMDRGAPISDTHSNRIIGKGINYAKTVVKDAKGEELPAIKITGKIFKNYQLDNVIWDKIRNKEYKGLSFGGATRTNRAPIVMKDGSIAYALKDLEHYEVAVCKDPAVPMALITDVNSIAKADHGGVERGDGKMVIQCTSMGCYVDKSSGNYVPEVDQNEEVWEKENKADENKPLNKPMRDDGDKKFKVYVKDPKTGNIITVRFGDPNMEIKRDSPENRSSFRARHKCSEQKDVTSAAYWSCKMWEKSSSVSDNISKTNWEVWLENKGAAGKGELFTPIRPSKQDSEDFDEEGNPIRKEMREPTKNFPKTQKILHDVATNNANTVRAAGDRPLKESKVTQEGDTAVVHKPTSRKFKPNRSFKDDQEEFGDYYDSQNQVLRSFIEDIEKADLGKYDTFQGKVNALMKEGYPEENAKKIVGAFVKGEKKASDGADGGTVMSTDAGVNNPVYNSKDEKKRKEDDDETDKDHSNSDGESHSMFNQDVGFDRKKNYFGGIRENYDGAIKQGGMEEEETNEIHRHKEGEKDENKYDKEKEKKEKTRDLHTINQSLEKHEKTMFLKSLYKNTKVQIHCGNCGSEISLKANEIAKVGKHGVSTCPHCGTRAMGVRNWGESPKNQKYRKPLKEPKHGTKKQEKRWAANAQYRKLQEATAQRDLDEKRVQRPLMGD